MNGMARSMRKALVQTRWSSGNVVVAVRARKAGARRAAAKRRSRRAGALPGSVAAADPLEAPAVRILDTSAAHHRFHAALRVVERRLDAGLPGERGLNGGRHRVADG